MTIPSACAGHVAGIVHHKRNKTTADLNSLTTQANQHTQALKCREPRHRLHDLRVYLGARAALVVPGLERGHVGGQMTACFFASLVSYGCLA